MPSSLPQPGCDPKVLQSIDSELVAPLLRQIADLKEELLDVAMQRNALRAENERLRAGAVSADREDCRTASESSAGRKSADSVPHTPGPWRQLGIYIDAVDPESPLVAKTIYGGQVVPSLTFAQAKANAEFIVRAANSFDDLLAALKALFADYKALADSGDAGHWSLEDQAVGKQALAAIQRAEGQR